MNTSKNLRVLAIDDSPRLNSECFLIGIIYRNGIIEGALSTKVEYDGVDSTEKIEKMVKSSRFKEQVDVIFLNSITVAGLNIVNIKKLSDSLSIPVIAITRHQPRVEELKSAVLKTNIPTDEKERKISSIISAGKPFRIKIKPIVYTQVAGIAEQNARNMMEIIGIEPIRLAHLIASALVFGESKGRF